MHELSYRPSITVTIGRFTRQYPAFVITAAAVIDGPKTVTLQEDPLLEVVGLAADPITHHEFRARTPARLVLSVLKSRIDDWLTDQMMSEGDEIEVAIDVALSHARALVVVIPTGRGQTVSSD